MLMHACYNDDIYHYINTVGSDKLRALPVSVPRVCGGAISKDRGLRAAAILVHQSVHGRARRTRTRYAYERRLIHTQVRIHICLRVRLETNLGPSCIRQEHPIKPTTASTYNHHEYNLIDDAHTSLLPFIYSQSRVYLGAAKTFRPDGMHLALRALCDTTTSPSHQSN